LCSNNNIPVSFFERNLDKIKMKTLCFNTNIPITFFDKYFPPNCARYISGNNFKKYYKNINKDKYSQILSKARREIKILVAIPPNINSCIPKGGYDYLKLFEKYV